MGRARPWLHSWRARIALVWMVGVSVTTVTLNAHYAKPALEFAAARQRAVSLDVDSSSRPAAFGDQVARSNGNAVGPNTQYLFDRAAERQRYAELHRSHAWGWGVLLTLFTTAALPFIFAMAWLGRRIDG